MASILLPKYCIATPQKCNFKNVGVVHEFLRIKLTFFEMNTSYKEGKYPCNKSLVDAIWTFSRSQPRYIYNFDNTFFVERKVKTMHFLCSTTDLILIRDEKLYQPFHSPSSYITLIFILIIIRKIEILCCSWCFHFD